MNRTSRRLLPPTALALAAALFAGQAIAGPKEDERATNAVRVLNEIQRIPRTGFPTSCWTKARRSSSSPTR